MPTILVTVDPTDVEAALASMHQELTTLGSWWHNIPGTWLIDTGLSATDVRDRLTAVVPSGARALVIEVTAHWAGLGLPDEAEEWLDAHT